MLVGINNNQFHRTIDIYQHINTIYTEYKPCLIRYMLNRFSIKNVCFGLISKPKLYSGGILFSI